MDTKMNTYNTAVDVVVGLFGRLKETATKNIQKTDKVINREIHIASLSQERKRLIYALGEKTYARIKGETDEPFARRIEAIDTELEVLKKQ